MPHTSIPTDLLESPSFQLERLRRRTRDEVEASLAEYKTSIREYWVLTSLATGSASSQTKSWVKRERDPKDRRRQIVASTKKGRQAQKELAELVTAAEDRALDESTSKQLKHLRKLAKAIIAAEED